MSVGTHRPDLEQRAGNHFEEATAEHKMTVYLDQGLYRHLRFNKPGTWSYGYDLVTWPGHLAINGDIGDGYCFARTADMIEFFHSTSHEGEINPMYWAEKLTGYHHRKIEVYSRDVLERMVAERFRDLRDEGYTAVQEEAIRQAWRERTQYAELEHEYPAKEALMDFEAEGFKFSDAWEWSLREWDYQFLLACFAIRAGVETYVEHGR